MENFNFLARFDPEPFFRESNARHQIDDNHFEAGISGNWPSREIEVPINAWFLNNPSPFRLLPSGSLQCFL